MIMSGRVLNWAGRADAGDAMAKAVLLVLAEAANEHGVTFVAQETVAKRLNACRATVNRAMKRLQVRGLIETSRRHRSDGSRSSNLIRLSLCNSEQRNSECKPNVTQSDSITPKINPQSITSTKTAKAYPESFEAVWKAYPHFRGRSDKAKSLAAWARLGGEEQALLSGGIGAFRATPAATKDGGQYVKAFERWIAGEQWRDFVPKAAVPAQPEAIDWAFRMAIFRRQGTWLAAWGEKPGREGCQVPREMLEDV